MFLANKEQEVFLARVLSDSRKQVVCHTLLARPERLDLLTSKQLDRLVGVRLDHRPLQVRRALDTPLLKVPCEPSGGIEQHPKPDLVEELLSRPHICCAHEARRYLFRGEIGEYKLEVVIHAVGFFVHLEVIVGVGRHVSGLLAAIGVKLGDRLASLIDLIRFVADDARVDKRLVLMALQPGQEFERPWRHPAISQSTLYTRGQELGLQRAILE